MRREPGQQGIFFFPFPFLFFFKAFSSMLPFFSAQGIITTLKSWTGIIYLSSSRRTSIQSIVDSLLLPFEDTRKQMLDIIFEIFRLKAPMWSVDFHSALRRTVDFHLIDGGVLEWVSGSTCACLGNEIVILSFLSLVNQPGLVVARILLKTISPCWSRLLLTPS